MRKIYVLLGCILLSQMSNNLSAQVIFSQDFSSATGNTPPTGWTNNEITGGELWEFNNPGERPMTFPISSPAAIFDSDNYGSAGPAEDVALESPVFDASAITDNIFLIFDHSFVNYESFGGGEFFVEVWDGSDWVEVMSGEDDVTGHEVIDITSTVNGAADAQVRFRWTGDWSYWWIVDNISVQQVSCLPVTNLLVDNSTTASFEVSWDAGGSETAWDLQWGPTGFIPGSGNEIGSVTATTSNPYTISGLSASMVYDVYVKVVCGSGGSLWVKVSGTTTCGPITNFPWSDSFEAIPELGEGFYPHCWSASEDQWFSDTYITFITEAPARTGANYVVVDYSAEDTLWTPEFQLTAGRQYEFKLHYLGDDYSGWDSKVVIYNDQTSTASVVPGGTILSFSDISEMVYKEKVICFSPTTSGVYKFGVQATSNGDPYVLVMDDFSLLERGASAGTNGTETVCQTGGLVDLNDIIVKDDQNGTWSFTQNQAVIENDSMFNPSFIPETTLIVNYITLGCLQDTATATITIVGPSTAGQNGLISVCKNEPMDLLAVLTGTVDHGGSWYNPQHNLLTSSQIMSPNFPGQYNYEYVVSNGVCPNDTSGVLVTVTSCDWLSVDESALEAATIYPNPSTGLVYIESNAGTAPFTLTVTDINGRTIETGIQSVTTGSQSVNLTGVQRGTYFFKLSNESAEKVYRVVIQ